jgi:hypothetical protein
VISLGIINTDRIYLLAFGSTVMVTVAFLLWDHYGTPPGMTVTELRTSFLIYAPFVGSIATLLVAVAIWAWANGDQSIQSGINMFRVAGGEYQDMNLLLSKRAASLKTDVEYEALKGLMVAVTNLREFLGRITRGWNPATSGHKFTAETNKYFDASQFAQETFKDEWTSDSWTDITLPLVNAMAKVNDGLTQFRVDFRMRSLRDPILRSAIYGLLLAISMVVIATVPFSVDSATSV